MDEELRQFLTEEFGGVNRRIDDTNQRLDGTNQRLDETNQRLDATRQELSARIDTTRSELGVLIERQQDQIRLMAEGHSLMVERLDALHEDLRREIQSESRETRALIKLSYSELDRRITRLETVTVDLETRLSRLEREG